MKMPISICPFCSHILDGAVAADFSEVVPEPEDVTVCERCASILLFNDDLTLRAPRPGEVEMTPELIDAQCVVFERLVYQTRKQ